MKEHKEEFYEGSLWSYPIIKRVLVSAIFLAVGFILHRYTEPKWSSMVVYLLAMYFGGAHWVKEGIEGLIEQKKVGIEILMLAATVGAVILDQWTEAAFLVFLYGAAEGLEEYTFAKTRSSIRALLKLVPQKAFIKENGKEKLIDVKDISLENIIVVRPGEIIATDGVIIEGSSSINEATITGESMPVDKSQGMKVFAGTINLQGYIEFKATSRFEDNTLSKIIHLVEEAQERKSRTQQFIDKFGRKYSPAVLFTALSFILVALIFGLSVELWSVRAVVLLVAAAPCALVMSTPVAVAAGIGRAGTKGILIKGGVVLENLGKVKVVCFDKTGTLTVGEPEVTNVESFDGSEEEFLRLACSIERNSEHPLAKALVLYCESKGVTPYEAKNFQALIGLGARAEVKGEVVYVGKMTLFAPLGVDISRCEHRIEQLQREAKTVALVGSKERIFGVIAFRDQVRSKAVIAVKQLRNMGIKVAMLTGDNLTTASAIAEELNIDHVKAGLKPEDKITQLQDVKKEFGFVAMVGDGINDAPALAFSDVGIAMGVAGSDSAIESADVALMSEDLTKVATAINTGRFAGRVSRQNILFSLLILAVLIPSAVSGMLGIAAAVTVHETSELLAVANGLRLRL